MPIFRANCAQLCRVHFWIQSEDKGNYIYRLSTWRLEPCCFTCLELETYNMHNCVKKWSSNESETVTIMWRSDQVAKVKIDRAISAISLTSDCNPQQILQLCWLLLYGCWAWMVTRKILKRSDQKWNWVGHTLRRPADHIARQPVDCNLQQS